MRRVTCVVVGLACVALAACAQRKQPTPAASQPSLPDKPPSAVLAVEVTGFRSDRGQILVCVFDRSAGFPGDASKAALWQRRPIIAGNGGAVRLLMSLPPGTYAVSAAHDENGNGRLDTGFMGVPSEGYGVSNNPPPRRGPPKFGEASFELPPGGTSLKVELRY